MSSSMWTKKLCVSLLKCCSRVQGSERSARHSGQTKKPTWSLSLQLVSNIHALDVHHTSLYLVSLYYREGSVLHVKLDMHLSLTCGYRTIRNENTDESQRG